MALTADLKETLTQKEFIERARATHEIQIQRWALIFLFCTYGGSLGATLVMFFLHGFKAGGFQLPVPLLHWLGGATVGALTGLLSIVYGALFRKEKG